MKFLSTKNLILSCALLSLSLPSHAVVLKQKWQAGQKLVYALDLDGTANVQLPPDAPGAALLAGVPLEVPMRGKGLAQFETLKVDEVGTGTLAVTVPRLTLDTQAMGQKFQLTLKDGKSQLTLNGQLINLGALPQGDGKAKSAVKIAANGQFKGVEAIPNPNKPAPVVDTQTPVAPEKAIDQGALMTATILRAFPALWPSRDVKVGDTWQSNVDYPALARPAQNGEAPKPLGVFDLKLEGEDVVNGKTLQRVTIKGDIELDGKTLETAFPSAPATTPADPKAKARTQPKLDRATETVEGTLWLDAEQGQVAKAELILGGQAQAFTPKPGGEAGSKSWFDFTGSLNLALQPN